MPRSLPVAWIVILGISMQYSMCRADRPEIRGVQYGHAVAYSWSNIWLLRITQIPFGSTAFRVSMFSVAAPR